MPENMWIWIIGIVLIGGIAGLALWRGLGVNIAVGKDGVQVHTDQAAPRDTVRVAENLNVEGTVGNVIGRVHEGTGTSPRAADVSVMNKGVVKPDGNVGDITGERITGTSAGAKPNGGA